uniref:DUF674 domain-containing protein n=1 Tax=Fagus sylvatica TaxID=28930 RepID=A0A2N9HKK1_FAGSY
MEETHVSLRLLIDTKSRRVLFAEAGKEFIDFLFHILALPVGTIISLLKKQGTVGSFEKIYESFESFGTTYLQPNVNKETLLKPKVHTSGGTGVPLLLPNIVSSLTSRKLYGCARTNSSICLDYVADDSRAICPCCHSCGGNSTMSRELTFVDTPSATNKGPSREGEGGYVKGVITYMVMDDLEVKPMSIISIFTLLNNFNIKEIGVLEEKVVNLSMDEGVKLLKASMQSKSVLTDVFLPMLKLEVKCKNDCVRTHDEDQGEGVEVEDEAAIVLWQGLDHLGTYNSPRSAPVLDLAAQLGNTTRQFVDAPRATNKGSSREGEGGYVKGVITYMVMDDLGVKPMSIISIFTLLNNFNIKEIGVLEEKVVNLSMDEGVKLLKASMQSKSVLTDVFLPMLKLEVKCKNITDTAGQPAVSLPYIDPMSHKVAKSNINPVKEKQHQAICQGIDSHVQKINH